MDGQRERFEVQVLPHLDAAYRFARWLGNSTLDAEDIVQEAMLRAFSAFGALRGGDVKSWLLAIVRNCHATHYRQRQRTERVPRLANELKQIPTAAGLDPQSAYLQSESEGTFRRLLGLLSAEHREVLALREIEELSYREIASVTALPIGTVMSRLARARSALQQQWQTLAQGGEA